MDALFVLLIFSLLLGIGFLAAFFWAHSRGQFDDSETPAMRILFDDYDDQARKHNVRLLDLQNDNALIENTDKISKKGVQHGS